MRERFVWFRVLAMSWNISWTPSPVLQEILYVPLIRLWHCSINSSISASVTCDWNTINVINWYSLKMNRLFSKQNSLVAHFRLSPIWFRTEKFWPFQHNWLYLIGVVTMHETTMHCLVQTLEEHPPQICSSWMWPRPHVPFRPYPKVPTETTEKQSILFSNIWCHNSNFSHFAYFHFTVIGCETFGKVIQSQCWCTVSTCNKCIICISTKYGTLASSEFTAKYQFLFRDPCCCHYNAIFNLATLNWFPTNLPIR